jgi:hypothetical protein
MAARGLTDTQLNHAFDHAVEMQARSLVLLLVPLFALVVWLLEWRKRRLFGEHLVFSLHFTAFSLVTFFIGIYGGSSVVLRALAHYGIKFQVADWNSVLAPFALAALVIYSFMALRRVYGDSILAAALKSLLLAASFDYVLDVYRFILFLNALYAS